MLNKWNLPDMTNRLLKNAALGLALSFAVSASLGASIAHAASSPPEASSSYTAEQAAMLGGKFSFNIPAGYAKDPNPLDPRAIAMGAKGASYLSTAEKSLLVTAQMPLLVDADSDDDDFTLSAIVKGTELEQSSSYKDFKKLGEKSVVKANGLGLRQLDTSFNLGGKQMLATSVVAASSTQSAVVTVLTNADNPKAHAALVDTVIGE